MLKVGDIAPNFTAQLDDGSTFTLSDYRDKQHVVLYFYVKDFTKGWTVESGGFRDNQEAIANLDGLVVGISADSVESHERFRASLNLPFNLIADTDRHIMTLYDVRRRLRLLPNRRVTYIVSKDGKIAGVYHHEMSMGSHISDVLEGLRALNDVGS